jgi:hypothetical protein
MVSICTSHDNSESKISVVNNNSTFLIYITNVTGETRTTQLFLSKEQLAEIGRQINELLTPKTA